MNSRLLRPISLIQVIILSAIYFLSICRVSEFLSLLFLPHSLFLFNKNL